MTCNDLKFVIFYFYFCWEKINMLLYYTFFLCFYTSLLLCFKLLCTVELLNSIPCWIAIACFFLFVWMLGYTCYYILRRRIVFFCPWNSRSKQKINLGTRRKQEKCEIYNTRRPCWSKSVKTVYIQFHFTTFYEPNLVKSRFLQAEPHKVTL